MFKYKCLDVYFYLFQTADCDEGYERNATGSCVLCARGYWRDLSEDDCRQCDEGKTTRPGIIAINKDKCSMGMVRLLPNSVIHQF